MDVGPAEIGLILLAVMLLFGYKKLPDAARSMGRSLRIFKSEMSTMGTEHAATAPAPPAGASPAVTAPAVTLAPSAEQPGGRSAV